MRAHRTEVVARRGHAGVKRGTQRVCERRGRRDGWCGACAQDLTGVRIKGEGEATRVPACPPGTPC
jgi:hypothetical protein